MTDPTRDRTRVVVTGAASGMGRACLERFHSQGALVAALDIAAVEFPSPDGDRLRAWTLDITDAKAVTTVFKEVFAWMAGVDVLVNAAGTTSSSDALELSEADFDRVMAVNVKGSFLCAQAAARLMAEDGGGAIVNISSIASEMSLPETVHYAASKGAIRSMTKALAVALSPHNIRVNAVAPGPTASGMGQTEIFDRDPARQERILGRVLRGRVADPSEMASAVAFLASGEADFITGTTLYVDGGVTAVR